MGSRDIVDIETRPWKVGFDDPVLEAGGIDRPLLRRGHGFRYDGLDIDKKELCHTIYDHFWVQSIERSVPENYQMIISMTLLEHVQDNAASAKSMFEALLPSGTTHHYVPSRWHPYALILRLVGPKLQKRLITSLRSEQEASVSGYPTFFNQCTSRAMRLTFERAGFEEVDIRPFYRANGYFAFFVPAFVLLTAFETLCRYVDWWYFASGFIISGRKPECR